MSAKLVYYFATSLDGFIAHPDGTWSGFLEQGSHVDEFLSATTQYVGVLMGRKTYEVGLAAGLPPGQPAYPGYPNYVFSSTLPVYDGGSHDLHVVRDEPVPFVADLKHKLDGMLWLCGGGVLAGALIEARLVDELIVKTNPTVFGSGVPLAAGLSKACDLELQDTKVHGCGVIVTRYRVPAKAHAVP